jgi:hypothetical protein
LEEYPKRIPWSALEYPKDLAANQAAKYLLPIPSTVDPTTSKISPYTEEISEKSAEIPIKTSKKGTKIAFPRKSILPAVILDAER